MKILNATNGPYLEAIDVTALFNGRWFKTGGDGVALTLTGELALAGGGNISGELFADFTADPQEARGITKLTFPDGCLHTAFATITLATQKIVLASALTASTLGLTFAFPPCGSMRFRWLPTSTAGIVAGVNTLTIDCQMGLDD